MYIADTVSYASEPTPVIGGVGVVCVGPLQVRKYLLRDSFIFTVRCFRFTNLLLNTANISFHNDEPPTNASINWYISRSYGVLDVGDEEHECLLIAKAAKMAALLLQMWNGWHDAEESCCGWTDWHERGTQGVMIPPTYPFCAVYSSHNHSKVKSNSILFLSDNCQITPAQQEGLSPDHVSVMALYVSGHDVSSESIVHYC